MDEHSNAQQQPGTLREVNGGGGGGKFAQDPWVHGEKMDCLNPTRAEAAAEEEEEEAAAAAKLEEQHAAAAWWWWLWGLLERTEEKTFRKCFSV
jgi:hypothetical protein